MPDAAWRCWQTVPSGMMETIVEYRSYARAKGLYDSATSPEARKALPDSPLITLVERIDFELTQEEINARRG